MIDAKNLALVERGTDCVIGDARRFGVRADGLFDNDAAKFIDEA